jgi:hypothetical protein
MGIVIAHTQRPRANTRDRAADIIAMSHSSRRMLFQATRAIVDARVRRKSTEKVLRNLFDNVARDS